MNEVLERAMRSLPSQGRGGSWVSRRDRALLVLHGSAGLSYADMCDLTVADVTVIDTTARITTGNRTVRLTSDTDDVLCGPCALARWLRTLEMTLVYPDQRVPTAVITRSAPLAAQSPHVCEGTTRSSLALQQQTLLPQIDQWGLVTPAQPRRRPLPGAAPRKLPKQQRAQPDGHTHTRAQYLEAHTQRLLHNDQSATNTA